MNIYKEVNLSVFLTWLIIVLVLFFLLRNLWRKRWLYYYSSKFRGPFSWPIIGNAIIFKDGQEAMIDIIIELFEQYGSLFRIWIGSNLLIFNGQVDDIEILLNTHLKKFFMYEYGAEILRDGLITAPVSIWKKHRKIINTSFSTKMLNSFHEIFVRNANALVKQFRVLCDKGEVDLITELWKCNLDIALENLTDVDSTKINGQYEYVEKLMRAENIMAERLFNSKYVIEYVFRLSPLAKEIRHVSYKTFGFCKKIIIEHRKSTKPIPTNHDNDLSRKKFLNNCLNLSEKNGSLNQQEILEEVQTLLSAASESTAFTISMVLLVLSIRTDIQDKVYQEQLSIFGEIDRDTTSEDINKMDYLERVLKETMRLRPVVPLIGREIDQEVKLGSYVYPKGSSLIVPIVLLNRNPELWSDPLTFNPDRFLPENIKNQHRCAFIPFSFGLRNCIGFKYAMLSMKILLSTILRHYRLSSSSYKSIWDIKMSFSVVCKPKDGCRVILTQRKLTN